MTDSPSCTSPFAWRRPLIALLAGFALASGMLAPHDAAGERAGMAFPIDIVENAVHPEAPPHFENAELKPHPGCVACLLQLQRSTVLSLPPAMLPPLRQSVRVAAPVARFASAAPSLLGPARAPPIASPFA